MKGKRFLSLVISAAMAVSTFSGLAMTSASAEVGNPDNNIWTASADDAGKTANTVLYEGDKGTLTTLFDFTLTTEVDDPDNAGQKIPVSETVGERTFSAYVSHPSQNGGYNTNGTLRDGYTTLLSFVPKADGVLTVYFRDVNSSKYVCILKDGALNYKTGGSIVWRAGTGESEAYSAQVEADQTYYMFVDGSKGQFMAVDYEVDATYEQPTAAPATPVPTVDPNSKSWTASAADFGRKAGDLLMGGLTLVSDNSSTNKAYVTATENGKIETDAETGEKTVTGSALKFVAPEDGALSVTMIDVGDTNEDGTIKTVTPVIYDIAAKTNLFEYTNTAAKETVVMTAPVEEGKTYYAVATGTKGRFSAASFTPASEVTETDAPSADATDTPSTETDAPVAPATESITYADGTVTVTLDDTTVTSGVLLHAKYNGGKIASVKLYDLTFTNGVAEKAVEGVEIGDKLMVWNSIEGMKPLCDALTVGGSVTPGETTTPGENTPAPGETVAPTTAPGETTAPTAEPSNDVIFRADDSKVVALTQGDYTDAKGNTFTAITPDQTVGPWTVYKGWQLKDASNVEYTHTDGTKYTFTKSLRGGSGSTTDLAVSFVPTGTCKVTAVFDGTGSADRIMKIAQNGSVIAQAPSVAGSISTVSAEITDITEAVYVYGGGSNKNLYAIIVEYMEPETQADYVKEWNFQQVNYGKAEAVADGLVCNDNISDQKNDGTNGKGFLTGSNGGEIKVPMNVADLDENKVGIIKITYNWDSNFDIEGVKDYVQSQGGDQVAEYIYDSSCVNDGYVTINVKGTTYIKEIDRTTLFKCPTSGTITSNSTKDLTGKNIVFTDKSSGNVIKVPYGATYNAELVNGRSYAISVEGMTDVCATLETMNFTANVKIDTFNITLMDIAETAITGEVVGLNSYDGVTLTFTNANDSTKTANAVITAAAEADTDNLNPVTGTLAATLMPNNTYNVTATGLPAGYSLSPLSQTYFMKAGDTNPFKNILIVKETPVVDYTTLTNGTINVGPNSDYKTINEAMDVVRNMINRGTNRVTLNLEAGATFTEQVIVDQNNVAFVSDADNKATIQWYYGVGYLYYSAKNGYYDRDLAVQKTGKNNATKWGCAVRVTGSNFLAENVNFDNTLNQKVLKAEIADGAEPAEPGSAQYTDGQGWCPERTMELDPKAKSSTERAAAICVEGKYAEFYNCKFQSSQDTLYTGSGAAYFKQCDIYGMTDYIFGGNSVLFEDCNLIWEGYSTEDGSKGPYAGYITAVKTSSSSDNGYVFKNCTVSKNSDSVMKSAPGAWGRNWGGANCAVYFVDTTIADGAVKPVGWTKMGGELSTSRLFVDGVYAAADTSKATDLTETSDNPNGVVGDNVPADMTVLDNWVPKHYEGVVPAPTEYITNWYFGKSNGAAEYAIQGAGNPTVSILGTNNAETTQTMVVDATNGKFNNASRTDEWAQVNNGTTFTFPVVAGSVITFGAYNAAGTLTINGTAFTSAESYTVPAGVTSVTATANDVGYMSFIKTTTPVENGKPADYIPPELSGTVSITGDVKFGSKVTASVADANVDGLKYQWQANTGESGAYVDIEGATSAEYTIAADYIGKTLKCVVTSDKATGSISKETAAVAKADMIGTVNITGTVKEGQTVTATLNGSNAETYTYQWQVSDENAEGGYANITTDATSASYTIAEGLAGKTLKCVITSTSATVAGSVTSEATSAILAKAAETPVITGTVSVTGNAVVGQILTATVNGLNDGATALYQWKAKGETDADYVNIDGATSSTYTISVDLTGKTIKCVVTTGSTTGEIASDPTAAVTKPTLTGTVSVTGDAKSGSVLTASVSDANLTDLKYQWQANTGTDTYEDITGATSASYTVQPGLIGKSVKCVVTTDIAANSIESEVKAVTAGNVDYKVDLTSLSGKSILTAEEIEAKSAVTFGLTSDGTRVEADSLDAAMVFTNVKYHSEEHGVNPDSVTVKVPGYTKVTIGTCAWGSDATLKNGDTVVKTISTNTGACYHSDKTNNVVVMYYDSAEPATLTLSGGSYWPYVAFETITAEDIPHTYTVSFSVGDSGALGVAPDEIKTDIGTAFTVPMNRTLYKEGYTLTKWTDGTNNYAPGAEVSSISEDTALTPVFEANTATLADTSVTFDFQRKNGAPTLAWQNTTGIYVSQATVDGTAIDVKLDVDTTSGKVANANWTDWAQVNGGTKFTVPVVKDSVITFTAMADTTQHQIGETTFNRADAASDPKSYTATTSGSVEMVNVGGGYMRTITVTYPAAAQDPDENKVTVSGAITLEGIYNNGGNKVDNYKMTKNDLVLKFTPASGTAVTATLAGKQGGTGDGDEAALNYTAELDKNTEYTVSLADTDTNVYDITAGGTVTTTEEAATNAITATKTYTYKAPVQFDANSYSFLDDNGTYTVTFNTKNGITPASLTFTKADVDADSKIVTLTGHSLKAPDTDGSADNYFAASFDATTVHSAAKASGALQGTMSTSTTANPEISFGTIKVTLASAPTGVTISGTPAVYQTLTAAVEPADAGVTYQWYTATAADATEDNWTAISGATKSTLDLSENEKDKYIAVKVTGTALSGTATDITESTVSAPTFEQKTYTYTVGADAIAAKTTLVDNADITIYNAVDITPTSNTIGDTATYPYKAFFRTDSNASTTNYPTTSTLPNDLDALIAKANASAKGGTALFIDAKTKGSLRLNFVLASAKNMHIYDITTGNDTQYDSSDANIINEYTQTLEEGHIYYVYSNSTSNCHICGLKYLTMAESKVTE